MLSDALREHLLRPRHAGRPAPPFRMARATNPVCGDVLHLFARESEAEPCLRFEAQQACSAVLALTSFALEHWQGWSREELRTADVQAVAQAAGGLPPGKGHAAELLQRTLERLLAEWPA